MFAVEVVGFVSFAIVPCPVDGITRDEHAGIGDVDKGDSASFAEVGAFGIGKEVGDGLGVNSEVIVFCQ